MFHMVRNQKTYKRFAEQPVYQRILRLDYISHTVVRNQKTYRRFAIVQKSLLYLQNYKHCRDPQMPCTHGSWNTTDLFT
jgi:hypothetical protein